MSQASAEWSTLPVQQQLKDLVNGVYSNNTPQKPLLQLAPWKFPDFQYQPQVL